MYTEIANIQIDSILDQVNVRGVHTIRIETRATSYTVVSKSSRVLDVCIDHIVSYTDHRVSVQTKIQIVDHSIVVTDYRPYR